MKKIINQAIKFFCVSGLGWIIDFCIFILFTNFGLSEIISNIFSSFAAITFVYTVSTNKLFKNMNENLNLKKKFVIYVLYQVFVVSIFSVIIGLITSFIDSNITNEFILNHSKIFSKIIVTPFTMCINFIFMKFLIERV